MSENTTTAVARTGVAGVKLALSQPAFAKRFEEILGKRAPQFMASIVSVAGSLPEDTEPTSIVTSAIVAATLDLPINKDLGFAWIVPYKVKGIRKAQFQMGYKGFVQLALRSGQYHRINARAINEEALGGFDEIGEPVIDWSKIDSSKPAAGYAVAWRLVNGFTKVCFWSRGRVEAHAKRYSQSYSSGYDSPWTTNFDEMAIKTVIKNELSDWGILSIEMQRAAKFDQATVIDVDSEAVAYPDREQLPDVPRAEATPGPKAAPFKKAEKPADVKPVADAALGKIGDDGDLGPKTSNIIQMEPVPEQTTKSAAQVGAEQAEAKAANPQKAAVTEPASTAAQKPSEPTSAKAAEPTPAEIPPSQMKEGWLLDFTLDDLESLKKALLLWLGTEEIAPEELMALLINTKRAKEGQTINDLNLPKLSGIVKNAESFRVQILKARGGK